MWVELRYKSGKYYVILRQEDSTSKPVAQFVSALELEAENVGKAMAKQNRCFMKRTSGGVETPELPQQPETEG
tara:strand:+ start:51 stop:269 length:219 start_codon:yes stop_codon:yes gene_type:complete